jgi:hypothetical protein
VARKNEAIEQLKLRSAYEKKFHHIDPNSNSQINPTFPLFGSNKLDPQPKLTYYGLDELSSNLKD